MEQCQLCGDGLKFLNTVTLPTKEKICDTCKTKAKKDLGLGFFSSFEYSLDDIYSMYEVNGVDLRALHQQKKDFLAIINSQPTTFERRIYIAGGNNLIATSTDSKVYQLDDERIYFKDNYEEFYYLISLEFEGPRFKNVTSHSSTETINNKYTEKERKKGKGGKVVAGAVLGNFVIPGVGAAVGAYAGSKGKDKKKKKGSQKITNHAQSNVTTKEVEEKSICYLELLRISDNKQIKITIKADSNDFHALGGLSIRENIPAENVDSGNLENNKITRSEAIQELKNLKELLDLGVLTQAEFDEKRKTYIDFL